LLSEPPFLMSNQRRPLENDRRKPAVQAPIGVLIALASIQHRLTDINNTSHGNPFASDPYVTEGQRNRIQTASECFIRH
jgi:hypothetical protein